MGRLVSQMSHLGGCDREFSVVEKHHQNTKRLTSRTRHACGTADSDTAQVGLCVDEGLVTDFAQGENRAPSAPGRSPAAYLPQSRARGGRRTVTATGRRPSGQAGPRTPLLDAPVRRSGERRDRPKKKTKVATDMLILGVILLLIGILVGIPILTTIGGILLVVGAVLWLLGATGRAVGGRKHYF